MVGMPGELFFSAASFLYGSLETEKNNVNSYKFGKGNEWFNGSVLFARWGNRVKKETARIHFGICFLHIYKCVRVRVRVRAHVCVSEVVKSREKSILQCSVFGSHPARKFVCTKSWNFCIILLSKHRNHVDQPCLQAVNLIWQYFLYVLMNHNSLSTYILSLKIMKTLCSCFVFVRNHH